MEIEYDKLKNSIFQLIVEASPRAIVVFDTDNRICYANQTATQLLGYSNSEFVNSKFDSLFQMEKRNNSAESEIATLISPVLLADGLPRDYIATLKSGKKIPVEVRFNRLDGAGEELLSAYINDATEIKNTTQTLEIYHHFFKNTNDLSCIANTSGYFEIVNPRFSELLGYSNQQLLETPFLDLIHPDDLEATLNEVKKLSQGELTISFINRYRKANGEYVWLEWSAKPNTETGHLYSIARNITERVKVEEDLRLAEQAKSDFFANVSHELRTPLSLILGPIESQISGGYGPVPDTQLKALQTVHNNAIRLLQLVNGLLDFAKFEAGKLKPHLIPTDINALIRSIIQDFGPMLKVKKIEAKCHCESDSKFLMVDRYLFERIVFNLFSNAIKFTRAGGEINVSVVAHEGKLQLQVSDTGIGISNDQLDHLFKKFSQIEGSATRRFDGTGLGLAMVKEFSELMGGHVAVKSSVGRGSTFTVEIPAEKTDKVPGSTEENGRAALVPKYVAERAIEQVKQSEGMPKVLICEDNEELCVYLSSLVSNMCQIKVARDGEEGLALVHEWKPDMVITDLMMPKKDGLEVCRTIKGNPDTANIVVVLLTAITHRSALIKGWEAKADEYLFKPFHPNELITRVKTLLSIINDRKTAASMLQKKDEELAHTNEELQTFNYSVSHDLKSPLHLISGFTQIVLKDDAAHLSAESVEHLQKIRRLAAQMDHIISSLLMLAKTSNSELHKTNVNMKQLAEDVVSELQMAHLADNTEINFKPIPDGEGNSDLLRQVWFNLISNAVKFSGKKENPIVEIGSLNQNGRTVYYVKDNGIGLNKELIAKLFAPFERLHKNEGFEGSGIGLSLIKRIIERHGGEIWAEGEEQVGSTFYFTLPVSVENAS